MMANFLQQTICGETTVMAMELHRLNSGNGQSIGKSGRDDVSTEYSNDRVQPISGGRLNGSAERPLKFSIDNILRPEFGGGSASGCNLPTDAVFNRYNHHYHHHHLQQQQHLHNIDRLQHLNYQLHHLSQLSQNAAAAAATVTANELATAAVVASSSSDHKSISSRRSSSSSTAEPPSSPIDLSCSDSQIYINPATTATNSTTSSSTKTTTSGTSVDAAISSVADKDGSGSQQWPAWVYCTRYSDRPSSGKT